MVDPNEIRYYDTENHAPGEIVEEDWELLEMNQRTFYRSFYRHFERGIDWEQTELYRTYSDALQGDSVPYHRCKTADELRAYFDHIDELYDKIHEEGFKSQQELFREEKKSAIEHCYDTVHPALNEVGVSVYKNGELSKTSYGRHRLVIAQLAGIEEIPVMIRGRHVEWQDLRDELRKTNFSPNRSDVIERYADHPDLRNLF
ncbi:hypothetical protein [Natronococcus pandeyae]|nr:hypothetical protein [Natronococcus pandeyae]